MNGLSLLALIAFVVAIIAAYRVGRLHGRGEGPPLAALTGAGSTARGDPGTPWPSVPASDVPAEAAAAEAPPTPVPAALEGEPLPSAPPIATDHAGIDAEKARLIVAYEADAARLRRRLATLDAQDGQLAALAEDRRRLYRELAVARGDTARYRQVVVDLENDAPPPILGERGTPDDLKLIVGIGPVLERMLQQLGIATYRQIAHWTEHDIDEMDARLPEFPGRIRRDAWVTQARALHQSKYGARP